MAPSTPTKWTRHGSILTHHTFSEKVEILSQGDHGLLDPNLAVLFKRRAVEIDARVRSDRDLSLGYFGFKTLERVCLLIGKPHWIEYSPSYVTVKWSVWKIYSENIMNTNQNTKRKTWERTYHSLDVSIHLSDSSGDQQNDIHVRLSLDTIVVPLPTVRFLGVEQQPIGLQGFQELEYKIRITMSLAEDETW